MKNKNTKPPKKGIPCLLEIAGTKWWWLIVSMSLAVTGALAQFTPLVAVYKIFNGLAVTTSIDTGIIWYWGYVALAGILFFGVLTSASLMFSHIAAFNILYELRVKLPQVSKPSLILI